MEADNSEDQTNKYVAFCDVLGFSASIERDFESTLQLYREFSDFVDPVLERDGVQISVYSDSILITGENLSTVAQTVQIMSFIALQHNMLIRGGISYGRHWEKKSGRHLFMVSDALVRSVRLEASIKIPAIVLGEEVDIPDDLWLVRYAHGQFAAPILHFDGKNIVNPFSMMWGKSAGMRASMLMEESAPEHRKKYEWFLSLHKAVFNNDPLIPEHILKKYLELGVLKFTPVDAPPNNQDEGAQ